MTSPEQKASPLAGARLALALLFACGACSSPASGLSGEPGNPILRTMNQELQRSFAQLKNAGKAPLYYLSYRITDCDFEQISAQNGALSFEVPRRIFRGLSVNLRVGNPRFDNTHFFRGDNSDPPHIYEVSSDSGAQLPDRGAGPALLQSLWLLTDEAFKKAQERYARLKTDTQLLAAEEDLSGDFSLCPPLVYEAPVKIPVLDTEVWQKRVRRLSSIFLKHPWITDSSVCLYADPEISYIVTSEGSRLSEQHLSYRIMLQASTRTEDGMDLNMLDSLEATHPGALADETALSRRIDRLVSSLSQLRLAPAADPYVGPAILSGQSAAVFFHETFGHRIEGHRQKKEIEGKTFARKLGGKIMPSFISVVDDPTLKEIRGLPLTGYYTFDDEGVRAQRVTLVKNGILTGYLLSRAPTKEFKISNGHGRGAPLYNTVPRQANLLVSADPHAQVPLAGLRNKLKAEAKRQHKQYGLFFEEIRGGQTNTTTDTDQSYSIFPVRVYKVFVDGRPDQLIRGVDIVGTPLASLEKIMAAGNDYAVFNGSCGAESGDISVSAAAPSLLVQSIEIKRSARSFERPPLLGDPSRLSK
jgi:TldD protein